MPIHANRAGDTAEHACLYEPSSFYLPESWCSTLFTSACGVVLLCWTSCAITRCREIMTPQLSIVKTRFAKASLRARCARHRSWRATCRLPNGCVGHSATQSSRWTLSYPIIPLDTQLPNRFVGRQSAIPTGRCLSNPSLRDASPSSWRSTLFAGPNPWSLETSNKVAVFLALRTPIQVEISSKEVAIPWETGPWCATLLTLP